MANSRRRLSTSARLITSPLTTATMVVSSAGSADGAARPGGVRNAGGGRARLWLGDRGSRDAACGGGKQ